MAEKREMKQERRSRFDALLDSIKRHSSNLYGRFMAMPLRCRIMRPAIAIVAVLLLALLFTSGGPGERPSVEDAQSIARILKAESVPIQSISVTKQGYEVVYAAEDAAERDSSDALLRDWAMILGVAGGHRCDEVSIVTTLAGTPLHRQTASCLSIRAFSDGELNEMVFLALMRHESLA